MCSKTRTRSPNSTASAVRIRRMYVARLATMTTMTMTNAISDSPHTVPAR